MTEPSQNQSEEERPDSHEEAVDIVRHDPALNAATDKNDAATDEDARTADSD